VRTLAAAWWRTHDSYCSVNTEGFQVWQTWQKKPMMHKICWKKRVYMTRTSHEKVAQIWQLWQKRHMVRQICPKGHIWMRTLAFPSCTDNNEGAHRCQMCQKRRIYIWKETYTGENTCISLTTHTYLVLNCKSNKALESTKRSKKKSVCKPIGVHFFRNMCTRV